MIGGREGDRDRDKEIVCVIESFKRGETETRETHTHTDRQMD